MAEYTNSPVQTVDENSLVLFSNDPSPCGKGLVVHRSGAGQFTLRGVTTRCSCYARYKATFGANIAVPEGGTVGEISLVFSVDGEPLPYTAMIVTPTAAEAFFNVGASVYVTVPCGCCVTLGVRNSSDQAVDVRNANLIIERM